jgi:ABC-type Na+ efflux pump permease subunit
VVDQDRTAESRALARAFTAAGTFDVVATPDDPRAVEPLFRQSLARAALIIPEGFTRSRGRGEAATAQMLVDGSDNATATIALGYGDAIGLTLAQAELPRGLSAPLEARVRTMFNPSLRSAVFIVPGLIVLVLVIVSVMLTALTVAREYEQGSMEQLFSTPVSRLEIILGKLAPYFLLGLVQVLLVLVVGVTLFDVPLRGSVGADLPGGLDLPAGGADLRPGHQHRHAQSDGRRAGGRDQHVPAGADPVGLHLPHRQHAAAAALRVVAPAPAVPRARPAVHHAAGQRPGDDCVRSVAHGGLLRRDAGHRDAALPEDGRMTFFQRSRAFRVRLLGLVAKELRQTMRDRRMIGILMIAPMIQLLVLGHAVNLDVDHVPILIADEDRTAESRDFLDGLTAGDAFRRAGEVENAAAALDAISGGRVPLAAVLPRGFAADLAAGRTAQVQLLVDGGDSNRAIVAQNAAQGYVLRRAQEMLAQRLGRAPGRVASSRACSTTPP